MAQDAISIRAGTCGAAAAPRTPKAARKTAREVVRRTLLAKGSGRLSRDKGSSMGEGRARRGTLPKEKDAPADVDGAMVAPPKRRRTPSMYLGGAPRESESEKRLTSPRRARACCARTRRTRSSPLFPSLVRRVRIFLALLERYLVNKTGFTHFRVCWARA